MNGPKTFTNYSFQIALWSTIIFALSIIIIGGIDTLFNLKWGFTIKDVIMSSVVLIGAIIVKIVGTKIINSFNNNL